MAFFVAGGPGLILAALCLGLRDPPRGSQDEHPAPEDARTASVQAAVAQAAYAQSPSTTSGTYLKLLRNKPYVLTILGYAAYTFALGGLAFWMPAFLERVRGIPRSEATVSFGAIVVITGFVGTFVGGWLGDYCARRSKQAHLWISAAATLIAAPFAWVALTTGATSVYLACMIVAQLCMFMSTGPINASIVNLVRPTQRASANALGVFAIHCFGDVPSPWLIGKISDAYSLAQAVKIVPVAILASAAIWAWAARAQRLSGS
jgi:sugar phosphate permease